MQTADFKFHEITLEDKAWMDTCFSEDDRNACEYTFANNFIWRKVFQVEVARVHDCLVIRFLDSGAYCYSFPVGAGDKKAAVEWLLAHCKAEGRKLCMSPLSGEDREQMIAWFPGMFLIEESRDDFDYIYAREKLASLAGKKLHGKRNHIARFKDGDDWSYEPMTADNLEECRTMTYTWIKMRSEKWNEEMEQEVMVLHEAFDHMEELELVGGVLRKAGEIVAFSMGEPLNSETFVVHFEKAYPDMQGAYPMINQQFVQNACEGYDYINREEDTGDPGLRKAKLSYYPEVLLKKYIAKESEVVYADPKRDSERIGEIWEKCFGDDEDYINFYIEHRMTTENMLVTYEDGQIVSMGSFLPVQYLIRGEYRDACYVYAVATMPEYRRRGLAQKILQFAAEKYKKPLILAPAGRELAEYYQKMGFQNAFEETRHRVTAGVTALEAGQERELSWCTEPVSAAEYVKIRDEKCVREGYVRWDETAVAYAMDVNTSCGGRTVAVVYEDEAASGRTEQADDTGKDILMYVKEGDVLVILETSLSENCLHEIIPELLEETGASEVECGQMAGMVWLPESVTGQQDEYELPRDGYLALTMG